MFIPMVNIVEFSQAVAVLDRAASPAIVDRALASASLDRRILERVRGFLPYRLEAVVLEHVARTLGDYHLGARLSSEFEYSAYAAYARYVLGARDLRMALERGRRAFPLISPGSAIVLWQEGDHLLVGRETGLNGVIGRRHLEDAALLIIQQVVRHYLGPHWQPAWVEIPGGERVRERFIEDAIGARVRTGRKMPAVAIPRCELSRTNPKLPSASDTLTFNDLPVLMGVSPPGSNVDAAFEVLRTQLGAEDLSEDGVARQLSMGPRTLQRLLKAEGTTFREVKARFLQDRALELLAESDLSVEAISAFLGYTEPNSFRRAFKAWTGISPTEFRAGCRGTLR